MDHWHSLITGGTRGIGRAIAARRLALGDEVTVVASTEKSIKQFNEWLHALAPDYEARTRVMQADLGTRQGIEAVVEALSGVPREKLIVFSNAGVYRSDEELAKETEEARANYTYLNGKATQDLIGKLMPARVVTTGSTAAHWNYDGGEWYRTTKRQAELATISSRAIGVDGRVVSPGNTDTSVQSNFDNDPLDVMRDTDVGDFIANIHDSPLAAALVIPKKGAKEKLSLQERVHVEPVHVHELSGSADELQERYATLTKQRYVPHKPKH